MFFKDIVGYYKSTPAHNNNAQCIVAQCYCGAECLLTYSKCRLYQPRPVTAKWRLARISVAARHYVVARIMSGSLAILQWRLAHISDVKDVLYNWWFNIFSVKSPCFGFTCNAPKWGSPVSGRVTWLLPLQLYHHDRSQHQQQPSQQVAAALKLNKL